MELLAATALGAGAAGVVLLLHRLSGGRLPRGLAPVAAGLAMIFFAVWSEYSWFDRHHGALPQGLVVTTTERESSWRPWSWVWPQVTRYAVVNVAAARQNAKLPGHVMTDTYLFERNRLPAVRPLMVDCPGHRRAELASVRFDDDGRPVDADWRPLSADTPLHRALCSPESAPSGE